MNVSTQSLQAALEPLVGNWVRPAADTDVVAGVQPRIVVEPGCEEEVAAVLAFADREGLRVLVRGGGTQLAMGFPPTGGDILLSTTRLNHIVEHVPHDLTVTVQAGLPLTALQSTLAQAQQWLALDPDLGAQATIGGVIATNATGPRRLRYGGVRDQIIGIRVVLADGTIAKGGGKVVKNVAGYDLPKLFTGALGTLGVIVTATFRLYPLAPASRTVLLTTASLASLCELVVQVIGSTLVPTMVDVLGTTSQANTYTMAVRFEMGQEAAEAQAATLCGMAKETIGHLPQTTRVVEGEVETQFWSQADHLGAPPQSPQSTVMIKTSLLPTEVMDWLTRLEYVCQQKQLWANWRAHAGHGLVFVHLCGDDAALVTAIRELRQVATAARGSLIVVEAPPELMQQLDAWGPSPALAVMRRLKTRFDPHSTLNAGRFVGGI
ncbi:MAG: FAD-binding oxidoreductase [Chloroflexi bacterium]|nr:FAD-binding oxidoreductase [Chloroflexota bacterium]